MNPPVDAPASRARAPDGSMCEAVESGAQLLSPAAHERRRVAQELDRLGRGHQAGRLVGDGARDQHHAPGDQLDGLGPAVGQAACDQRPVEALAGGRRQSADPEGAGAVPGGGLLGGGLLGRGLLGCRLLGRGLLGCRLLGRGLLGRRLLGRRLLGRRLLSRGLLGGRARAADQGGHLVGQVLEVVDAHCAQLTGDLGPDGRHDHLGALAAPLEQLLHPGLGLVGRGCHRS